MKNDRLAAFTSVCVFSFVFAAVSGCSSGQAATGTPTPPPVSITVSPTSANVQVGSTAQFSSIVTGSANVSVTWLVNGTSGGSAAGGAVSASGLYTAPSSVSNPSTVTVTAVSSADSTKSASATVSILPLPISIVVTPASEGVIVSQTQLFSATVSNTANTSVIWNVNGTTGGSAQSGTISTAGLYTAPSSVPSPSTVTVTAVSSADSTKSGSAMVSILPPSINVAIAPASVSVVTSRSQQFSATVSNTANTSVVWSVNGTTGGSNQYGTISTSGLYTAPPIVPSAPIVTVTATSVADTTKSSSAQATIRPLGTFSYLAPPGMSSGAVLVADPNNSQTLYAAPVSGGLYKTTNLGTSWTLVLSTFTGAVFSPIIAPASGTLYALGQNSYQTSSDGGKTFSASAKYPGGLDSATNAFTFAVDPRIDSSIYILSSTALMHSTDGGSTWTNLTAPPVPSLEFGSSLLVSSGASPALMNASCLGFAISTNGGTSWSIQNTGLDPSFLCLKQLVQDPLNPSRLLAVGGYSGSQFSPPTVYVYVSTDGGSSWTKAGVFGPYDRLVSSQTGPGIYVSSQSGLFESLDSGKTFKNLAPPSDPLSYTAIVSPVFPMIMAYEGFNDLSISQDGGSTWSMAETGLNARSIGQVAYAGVTGPFYASAPAGQFWRVTDPIQPWARPVDAYSRIPIQQFDVDPQNPLHLVAIEQSAVSGSTEYTITSSDGGNTWTNIPYAAGMQGAFASFSTFLFSQVRFGSPGTNTVFACGTFGVAQLSTVTNTWTIIDNGIPSGAGCIALGIDKLTSGTVYADTTSGVYKTTDSGNNWSLLLADSGTYGSILVDPTNSKNIFLSARLGFGFGKRSTDGGMTWSQIPLQGIMAFHPGNPNIMYAVNQEEIFGSIDSGATWSGITSPINFLEDLAVLPNGVVLVSTYGSGVLEFTPN